MRSKMNICILKRSIAAVVAMLLCILGLNIVPVKNLRTDVNAEDTFMSAREACDAINVGWNLGNTLDSYGTWISGTAPSSFETAWGNPQTSAELIALVRNSGFNAIRIPVTWAQHVDEGGNIDGAWLDRVEQVVDMALDQDLFVILNVHHDTGETGEDKVAWLVADTGTVEANMNRYRNLWTQICNRFSDRGEKLLFEGYNEILDNSNSWGHATASDAYTATNTLAQAFVDTVRATGGNNAQRNLIVSTYVASHEQVVLDSFVLPNDPSTGHLLAEVHVYAPWGFTGTAESVTWTTVHDDFGDADRAELTEVLNTVSAFSERIGVPVIIGECGAEGKGNDTDREAYAAYLVSEAAERGIKCFWWDNGQTYSIIDRNALTVNQGIVNALVSNSVSAEPDQVEETESSGTEAAQEETETNETAESAGLTETVEETSGQATGTTEETTSATTSSASDDETAEGTAGTENQGSSKKNFKPVWAIVIGGGVIGIAAVYKFIFEMGKRNRD